MDILKHYLTKNECYIRGGKHNVKGALVHSTGANNPKLSRYIDDEKNLGKNTYGNHWNQARPGGRKVCVHGFIGLDKDNNIRTVQTLPWEYIGWHAGGSANYMGYVGFEICEDELTDETYFNNVMNEAQELCAYLMKTYGFGIENVISHHEAHVKGIASNHGDIDHWLKKHGKDMKWFRSCVMEKYNGNTETSESTPIPPSKPSSGLPNGVESYSGFVEITYGGSDGIDLHSKPTFDGNVSEVVKKGTVLTIIGRIKVNGTWMYYTKAGHYVTGSSKYVEYRTTLHSASATKPQKPKMTARQFALEVWIEGKHGNGDTRKAEAKRLGVDYNEVQRLIKLLASGKKI